MLPELVTARRRGEAPRIPQRRPKPRPSWNRGASIGARLVGHRRAGLSAAAAPHRPAAAALAVKGDGRRVSALPRSRDRRRAQRLARRRQDGARCSPPISARAGLCHRLRPGARHRRRGAQGSLATGTVAVLAGGLDQPYPPENVELCAARSPSGGAASRKCRSAGSRARRDFPRRNRLIAGLSLGAGRRRGG